MAQQRRKRDGAEITRRAFLTGAASGMGASLISGVAGADRLPEAMESERSSAPALRAGSVIRLAGNEAEFVFDLRSGALAEMRRRRSNAALRMHPSYTGVCVWLGDSDNPDRRVARVSPEVLQPVEHEIAEDSQAVTAVIRHPSLYDADGRATGILCEQRFRLARNAAFVTSTLRIVNGSDLNVTGLHFGVGGIDLPGSAEDAVLTAPNGYMGTQWRNPRAEYSKGPAVFSVPPTAPQGLVCSWLHLGSPEAGVGIGYLDRRGMDSVAVASFGSTDSLGWRVFRYEGAWAFMDKINGPLQVYPLCPGEEFTTGVWFAGVGDGDWHETARFYRSEYEKTFRGDFLTWDETSTAARDADVIFNLTASWGKRISEDNRHDLSQGEVRNRFLDVPAKVSAAIEDLKVDPSNVLVVMLGQATHWGIYKLPDYFPVNQEAGGPEAFKEMNRQLRQDIGVAGTHFYAHAAFNHPQADNYVAEADTGWDANLYANYDHLGRIACMDSDGWWRLWRDTIIPGFVESGASGIEFDEGFGHHFICSKPGHIHGTGAVSVLTAQPRGALRIFRECKRVLGPEGYLECEGGSDIGARHIDLWESSISRPVEIVRYTHPDKLITVFWVVPEDVNKAFILGLPILLSIPATNEEFLKLLKAFVRLRNGMREQRVPGYPNGFRDVDGLTVHGSVLRAKVFSSDEGITVAYYSTEGCDTEVRVDGRVLGHPKLRATRRVRLAAQEAGFFSLAAVRDV